ncbi:Protein of unknown function [Pyronema omphalodes CBS 100304]|uniref:Uncharacterized protein n=1 Tax=Pyronema omphalodes (strain CBS 100304) TaxID=1076935 RepID=U4LFA7_PYROM|nr:Protein of unknown function [Pyronema omphalodes CBS 100304]
MLIDSSLAGPCLPNLSTVIYQLVLRQPTSYPCHVKTLANTMHIEEGSP